MRITPVNQNKAKTPNFKGVLQIGTTELRSTIGKTDDLFIQADKDTLGKLQKGTDEVS